MDGSGFQMRDIDDMSKKELRRLCHAQEVIGHAMRAEITRLRDRLDACEVERDMEPIDSGWPPCMDVDDGETLGDKITAFALPLALVASIVCCVVMIAATLAAVI